MDSCIKQVSIRITRQERSESTCFPGILMPLFKVKEKMEQGRTGYEGRARTRNEEGNEEGGGY